MSAVERADDTVYEAFAEADRHLAAALGAIDRAAQEVPKEVRERVWQVRRAVAEASGALVRAEDAAWWVRWNAGIR